MVVCADFGRCSEALRVILARLLSIVRGCSGGVAHWNSAKCPVNRPESPLNPPLRLGTEQQQHDQHRRWYNCSDSDFIKIETTE